MTETPKMALVPVEPTQEMLSDAAKACRDFVSEQGRYPRSKAVHRAMLKAAPHSGRVSREDLERAATAQLEAEGKDPFEEVWVYDLRADVDFEADPPDEVEVALYKRMESLTAALRSLGLEVDDDE